MFQDTETNTRFVIAHLGVYYYYTLESATRVWQDAKERTSHCKKMHEPKNGKLTGGLDKAGRVEAVKKILIGDLEYGLFYQCLVYFNANSVFQILCYEIRQYRALFMAHHQLPGRPPFLQAASLTNKLFLSDHGKAWCKEDGLLISAGRVPALASHPTDTRSKQEDSHHDPAFSGKAVNTRTRVAASTTFEGTTGSGMNQGHLQFQAWVSFGRRHASRLTGEWNR